MNVHYKVILLGDVTVGKSSISQQLVRKTFRDKSDSTIGAAYALLKHDDLLIDLWDTAGQERYNSIIPVYYRDADIVILVFDVNNVETFKKVNYYINKITTEEKKRPVFIVVGNKTDLITRQSRLKVEERINKEIDTALVNTFFVSAKTGENILTLEETICNICYLINKVAPYSIKLIDEPENKKPTYLPNCQC